MLRFYSVFIFEKSLIMKSSAVPVLVTIQFQDYPPPPKKYTCTQINARPITLGVQEVTKATLFTMLRGLYM